MSLGRERIAGRKTSEESGGARPGFRSGEGFLWGSGVPQTRPAYLAPFRVYIAVERLKREAPLTTEASHWDADRLNRKEDATFLYNFVMQLMAKRKREGRTASYVLNVDADWGAARASS